MSANITESSSAEPAKIIASGGLIAFRTDTFYGLGVDPLNRLAVRKIKELKGREDTKPILLLISDYEQVARFITPASDLFLAIANHFWPGPLTLVSKARAELPEELTAGTGTVGLRLPDDDDVRSLIRACGGALTATSANPSGDLPARSAADVQHYFGDQVDLVVNGGRVTVLHASTVLDLSGPEPRLVREGAISKATLSAMLREKGVTLG
jgi:L-threonylcarbamoyladenylate synthase